MKHLNIEIKAKCSDHEKIRSVLKLHNADFKGTDHQMEIEAIDSDDALGKEKLLEQCQNYLDLFGIPKHDLISVSYSDLLLGK